MEGRDEGKWNRGNEGVNGRGGGLISGIKMGEKVLMETEGQKEEKDELWMEQLIEKGRGRTKEKERYKEGRY